MDLGLTGRTAFVAASSKGLGKSVAMHMAGEGANVVICGRHREDLQIASEEISSAGDGDVLAITGDLTRQEDRKIMVKSALERFGVIDILVTNSGGPPAGLFEQFEEADWKAAYALLLESAVDLIRGFLPGMQQQRWGRIIAITSVAVKQPVQKLILSNSVRASVAGLIKTLAAEIGPYNITANNVMPGYTLTERLSSLLEVNPALKRELEQIPLGRFGRPEEFAAAVTFLASEPASYINGISLPVDGGWIKAIV